MTRFPCPALVAQPRWVVARLEAGRDGRRTKVPYCADNPTRKASSTDPSTWSTFDAARQAIDAGRAPLLGFMLGDGFVGVDLDHCRDGKTRYLEPWAEQIVNRLDSYAETSVSCTGVHIICRGVLPPGGRRKGPVEMYDRARFFVMTGRAVRQATVEDRTAQLAELHAEIFPAVVPRSIDMGAYRYQALTDDDVLRSAATATNGDKFLRLWRGDLTDHGGDHSAADLALVAILWFWCGGDREQVDRLFRQSNLVRPKWTDRLDYRDRTFAKAVTQ